MYRFFTIFIFLCALPIATNGQSAAVADSLFAHGDYEGAAVEYERCVFKAESRTAVHQALVCKAECLKRLGHYGRAAATLERCADRYGDYLQLALCRYLDGDFGAARAAGGGAARAEMLCDTVGEDLLLLHTLSLNGQALYDSARAVALRLADLHSASTGSDIAPLIDSLYADVPHLKNETLAWYLSLLPGLGHLYAGEAGLAAAAFTLNAACLAFGVWQVLEGCYLTAYLGGAGLLSVTYPGAMRSAAHYVKRYNYRRTADFNSRVKEYLVGECNN